MRVTDMEPDDVGLIRNGRDEWVLKLGKPGRRLGVVFTHLGYRPDNPYTAEELRTSALAHAQKGVREPRRSRLRFVGEVFHTYDHYVKAAGGPRELVSKGLRLDESAALYRDQPLSPGDVLTVLGSDGSRYTREAS
jgi:hypothetical protein